MTGTGVTTNIASRGATMAVDWEQRIDFAKLRGDRLEKARASLRDSELGAVLLFDQNNIRYVSSTHIGEWARDKSARCVLLPREGDPVLWDFGSAARHHRLYAPWHPESSWQAGVTSMRGAMPRETGVPDALAAASTGSSRERGLAGEPLGHRPDRHGDPLLAATPGHRDRRRPAGDDARPRHQDGGGDRAARARGRDRRRGLRGDLPDASPGRARARGRGNGDGGALRARLGAGRGDQCRLGRPLQSAPSRVLRPAAAARRPGVLRHHPLVHGLPDVLLPHVQRRLASRSRSSTRTSSAASGSTTRSSSYAPAPPRTRSPASGQPRRSSASPTSSRASACSSATASGSASTRHR